MFNQINTNFIFIEIQFARQPYSSSLSQSITKKTINNHIIFIIHSNIFIFRYHTYHSHSYISSFSILTIISNERRNRKAFEWLWFHIVGSLFNFLFPKIQTRRRIRASGSKECDFNLSVQFLNFWPRTDLWMDPEFRAMVCLMRIWSTNMHFASYSSAMRALRSTPHTQHCAPLASLFS